MFFGEGCQGVYHMAKPFNELSIKVAESNEGIDII
jgi:hypothetical protein